MKEIQRLRECLKYSEKKVHELEQEKIQIANRAELDIQNSRRMGETEKIRALQKAHKKEIA